MIMLFQVIQLCLYRRSTDAWRCNTRQSTLHPCPWQPACLMTITKATFTINYSPFKYLVVRCIYMCYAKDKNWLGDTMPVHGHGTHYQFHDVRCMEVCAALCICWKCTDLVEAVAHSDFFSFRCCVEIFLLTFLLLLPQGASLYRSMYINLHSC